MSSERDGLKNRLWPLTLGNALSAPYFRTLYGVSTPDQINDFIASTPVVSALPFTDKIALRTAGASAQVTDREPCWELFTGGSSGSPFVSKVKKSELDFLHKFFTLQIAEAKRIRRGIRLGDLSFVTSRNIPVPIHFHDLSIYGQGNLAHGLKILAAEVDEQGVDGRCSVLAGGERALRALTSFAEQHEFFGKLDFVYCYGTCLTKRNRQKFAQRWGASIIDRYGLTEVFGGATESLETGWYHFDAWVVPEVVDYESRQPIQEGIGVVVLTSLFPFQQAQPMVRYWTGDIARVTHSLPHNEGIPLIQPLGRADGGIYLERYGWALLQSEIAEITGSLQDIASRPWFLDSPEVPACDELGYRCFRLNAGGVTNTGEIEISVSVQPKSGVTKRARENLVQELQRNIHRLVAERAGEQVIIKVDVLLTERVAPQFCGVYSAAAGGT